MNLHIPIEHKVGVDGRIYLETAGLWELLIQEAFQVTDLLNSVDGTEQRLAAAGMAQGYENMLKHLDNLTNSAKKVDKLMHNRRVADVLDELVSFDLISLPEAQDILENHRKKVEESYANQK